MSPIAHCGGYGDYCKYNRVKQHRAWLLLTWPACPAIGRSSAVTFKSVVTKLSGKPNRDTTETSSC
ncbi:hypothetical protein J6590_089342 [Homalodisca vitripennis]|nr:hypothetical protein J6590_089342 [Homalodisca vitripennis]